MRVWQAVHPQVGGFEFRPSGFTRPQVNDPLKVGRYVARAVPSDDGRTVLDQLLDRLSAEIASGNP